MSSQTQVLAGLAHGLPPPWVLVLAGGVAADKSLSPSGLAEDNAIVSQSGCRNLLADHNELESLLRQTGTPGVSDCSACSWGTGPQGSYRTVKRGPLDVTSQC